MGLIPAPVETRLSAIAACFTSYDYRGAEKAAATMASSDWAATKDFIRPLKLLATLGLAKSRQ